MSGASPSLGQLAFCTSDVAWTVRLYAEALGFADSGGNVFWGRYLGEIQRLGADATCLTWWMVGRQARIQLELFQHISPAQRPQPVDWRASDIGWGRWGVSLPDLDDALRRLVRLGASPTSPGVVECGGLRRACIRDPGTRTFIELIEDGPAMPGGVQPRENSLMPAVVYATVSVADLTEGVAFYAGVLGLEETEIQIHDPELHALWGLAGARCRSVVLRAGDAFVEVVEYESPAPRRIPPDRRLSDQGFMNVGLLAVDRAHFDTLLARAAAAGMAPHLDPPDRPSTEAYLTGPDGTVVELMLVPREFEQDYGFVARRRFPPSRPWPEPRVAAFTER